MLKKIITIGSLAGLCGGILTACSGAYQSMMPDYSQYVDLGEYKGIEVTKVEVNEVTDVEDVLNYIKEDIKDFENSDTTETGDIITINSVGKINGEEFENGSLEEFEYEIGSGQLIEGFDEQLVGKKANEEFDITATFPEDYGNEELNGKEAIFTTTITKIERPVETELNDDWIKNHEKEIKELGYEGSTLEELKEDIKEKEEVTAKENAAQTIYSEAIEVIKENSTIKSYPEEEVQKYIDNITKNVKDEYNEYSTEFDSFDMFLQEAYELENEEALNEYAKEQSQEYVAEKMMVTLIAEDAGITISDEEVNKLSEKLAPYYGFESFEKMVEEYGEDVKEDFAYQTLQSKVANYLAEISKQTKEPEDAIELDDSTEEVTDEEITDEGVVEETVSEENETVLEETSEETPSDERG